LGMTNPQCKHQHCFFGTFIQLHPQTKIDQATLCHICISSCHWTSYATLYSTHHSTMTRSFTSRYDTQSRRCNLIMRKFQLCKDSQTDKRHMIIDPDILTSLAWCTYTIRQDYLLELAAIYDCIGPASVPR
jgi:hypothetical protein